MSRRRAAKEILLRIKQIRQPLTNDRMIVHDQNSGLSVCFGERGIYVS